VAPQAAHGIVCHPVQHFGYIVDDIPTAVQKWVSTFGAGPFFWIGKNLSLPDARYYEQPCVLNHSAVVGRWGDTFVELLKVHDISPAGLGDVFLGGVTQAQQLHHICFAVDDPEDEVARLESVGIPRFWHASQAPLEVSYCDGRHVVGHVIELHKNGPQFNALFGLVEQAARNWNGEDPIRELPH
jgi:Glyoxalase/Bleomycin resistance protein/Dioxygenase superfamily